MAKDVVKETAALAGDTNKNAQAAGHDARNDMQWSGWVPADRGHKSYSDGSDWNSKNAGDLVARVINSFFNNQKNK